MLDQFGRIIDYLRVSVTDRCNLRCRYCMPEGVAWEKQDLLLRDDEILRICRAAAELGIGKIKITGGEPLLRVGCTDLIAALKALPKVEQVTMTTNGLLLGERLDALCEAGLDAVNLSLDTLDGEKYRQITGRAGFQGLDALGLLERCCEKGLRTKVNAVLLPETRDEICALAAIAGKLPVDVRFIELMPIGWGSRLERVSPDEALAALRELWPDLRPVGEKRGNGPAHYYASHALLGRIGVIDAVSHRFCESCNRIRLTSTGQLKPCLCYDSTVDLRALLRSGCSDEELLAALQAGIRSKPRAHRFDAPREITERRMMSQIGG